MARKGFEITGYTYCSSRVSEKYHVADRNGRSVMCGCCWDLSGYGYRWTKHKHKRNSDSNF